MESYLKQVKRRRTRLEILTRNPVNPYIQLISEYPDQILEFEDFDKDLLRLRELLQGYSRVVVELGSGSGGHLIERAKRDPAALCLGFEIRFKRSVRTVEKALKGGIRNLCLCRVDARIVDDLLGPNSVDDLYVNFPDPWPRRRSEKNRLLRGEFWNSLHTILKPQAKFYFKTDNDQYFSAVLSELSALEKFKILGQTLDLHASPYNTTNVVTEFEKLFLSQGEKIKFLEAIKV
ncbi:tRNA (guanosine(46)-N7)-methyltransferase TrmB [bacterium]|nr:tRNA (guanosine(46)-N7)-methyltransferase TrmB [bacterium]